MTELTDTSKFNLETAKETTGAVKNILKDSKVDDKVVKIAEIADSILKNIVVLIEKRQNAQGNNENLKGVTNPDTSNVQQVTPKKTEVEINYRISDAYKELKDLIKNQEVISLEISLKELIDDEGMDKIVLSEFAQNKIKEWIKKYSEVTFK